MQLPTILRLLRPLVACAWHAAELLNTSQCGLCLFRHAGGCTGHLQADAARQASHDVLSDAVPGDTAHLQEVHDRRMSLLCKGLPARRSLSMAPLSSSVLWPTRKQKQAACNSPAQQALYRAAVRHRLQSSRLQSWRSLGLLSGSKRSVSSSSSM